MDAISTKSFLRTYHILWNIWNLETILTRSSPRTYHFEILWNLEFGNDFNRELPKNLPPSLNIWEFGNDFNRKSPWELTIFSGTLEIWLDFQPRASQELTIFSGTFEIWKLGILTRSSPRTYHILWTTWNLAGISTKSFPRTYHRLWKHLGIWTVLFQPRASLNLPPSLQYLKFGYEFQPKASQDVTTLFETSEIWLLSFNQELPWTYHHLWSIWNLDTISTKSFPEITTFFGTSGIWKLISTKKLPKNLPQSMKHLEFGDDFNQELPELPPSLTHLQFGDDFNRKLPKNLPRSLKNLETWTLISTKSFLSYRALWNIWRFAPSLTNK